MKKLRGIELTKTTEVSLETLERRRLLSTIAFLNPTGEPPLDVQVSDTGICSVRGTNNHDQIVITWSAESAGVKGRFAVNGQILDQAARGFRISAGDGDDTVQFKLPAKDMFRSLHNTIYGGSGNDMIIGSAGKDRIYGQDGNDTIVGMGGTDMLYGEAGDDVINGRAGGDHLAGGKGNDTLAGSSGADKIIGEGGNDLLSGGSGNDMLDGGDGNDTLGGGKGDDAVFGQAGTDQLFGGPGDDAFFPDPESQPNQKDPQNMDLSPTADIIQITPSGGVIYGGGALVKTGSSAVNLTGSNTYSGGTVVQAGTLTVNNTSSLGGGTLGAVTMNGGRLQFSRTNTSTFAGVISGSGGATLIKSGSGTLSLGQWQAPGLLLSDGVVYTIGQPQTVSSFQIDPGGTLKLTALPVEGAAPVTVTTYGAVTLNGGAIDIATDAAPAPGTYLLIDYTGALNGSIENLVIGQMPSDQLNYQLVNNTDNTSVDLLVTAKTV